MKDAHHYKTAANAYQPLREFQEHDKMKYQLAQAKGITLVQVPFWWDGQSKR